MNHFPGQPPQDSQPWRPVISELHRAYVEERRPVAEMAQALDIRTDTMQRRLNRLNLKRGQERK